MQREQTARLVLSEPLALLVPRAQRGVMALSGQPEPRALPAQRGQTVPLALWARLARPEPRVPLGVMALSEQRVRPGLLALPELQGPRLLVPSRWGR